MGDVVSLATKPYLQNYEAESQVIGAILLNSDVMHSLAGILKPEHFAAHANAEIFRAARKLVAEGKQATPITLKPFLNDAMFEPDAVRYMLACVKNHAHAVVAEDYAGQIVELALRRHAILTFRQIEYSFGRLDSLGSGDLITQLDGLLSDIRSAQPRKDFSPEQAADIAPAFVQRLMDMRNGEIPKPPSTGLKSLDMRIGGYAKGELHVVGGRPGSGKTIFAVCGMRNVVGQKSANGKTYGAMYFSLEVPSWDIMNRLVSIETRFDQRAAIPYSDIKRPDNLSDYDLERIAVHANRIRQWPIAIIDQPSLTLSQIESKVREQITRFDKDDQNLDVVFIDYLQLIKPSDRYKGSRVQEVTEISAGLLSIAKRYDVAVVALSQLSRNVENRENKLPNMSDLRESGSIEQDANNVAFLYRPAYYAAKENREITEEEQNLLTINVDKARDGRAGLVNAYVDVATNFLCDMERMRT